MKIGIMGAGGIAEMMAKTLSDMGDTVTKYAIASRTKEKAEGFAKKWNFEKAYGSYEEMVRDPEVQLVYIATPHSEHAANARMCIENGKAVLCEKAFTKNAKEAKEILAFAKEKNVLVTEAIWTRYMPSRDLIDDMIESGIVGNITNLTATLHYHICDKQRIIDPKLAGGALLDVGVYPLNFALMHFGYDIDRIESNCSLTDTGVDGTDSISIYYKDGRTAQLTAGIYGRSDRKGIFYGDKGYIIVENINNPQVIRAYDDSDNLIKEVVVPTQLTGYEYEVYETIETMKQGMLECDSMPHTETIQVMEIMDGLREVWGVKYPGE